MKLGELAAACGIEGLGERFGPQAANLAIAGLTADSRQVAPGYLFVALKGTAADGAAFIPQAIEKGAVAVLTHEGAPQGGAVPIVRLADPRQALSRLAGAFYSEQPEIMVAVTGTAGKTSVASFVRQIWEGTGRQAASIGTTGVTAPGREEYGSLTTPDPVALHALLTELAQAGVTHCSMEASSHGSTSTGSTG